MSDIERMKRLEAVNFARANVGLEGFTLSEAEEARAHQFVDGEISLVEFVSEKPPAADEQKPLESKDQQR